MWSPVDCTQRFDIWTYEHLMIRTKLLKLNKWQKMVKCDPCSCNRMYICNQSVTARNGYGEESPELEWCTDSSKTKDQETDKVDLSRNMSFWWEYDQKYYSHVFEKKLETWIQYNEDLQLILIYTGNQASLKTLYSNKFSLGLIV